MTFNSLSFAVFFPLVALAWFACPFRWRWVVLVGANGFFYLQWGAGSAAVLLTLVVASYLLGRFVDRAAEAGRRRRRVAVAIVLLLAPLLILKYRGFVIDTLAALGLAHAAAPVRRTSPAVSAIGVSFYTFQALAYVIDVGLRRTSVERHLGRLAAFLSFFPTVLMGPIERAGRLLPQLAAPCRLDVGRVTSGLRLFTWGLFQKIVVADRLAVYVSAVYSDPRAHTGATLLLATISYTLQIYADFSGYSDMAIAVARMLGLDLTANFRRPYFAHSVVEFWRRWHISLTSWFRDYVYIALGGNRVAPARWAANILLVFVLSGLWHGAAWTFVVWGAVHGAAYLIERAVGTRLGTLVRRLPAGGVLARVGGHAWTLAVVAGAWVFFRARSPADALYILKQIAVHPSGSLYRGASQITTAFGLAFAAVLLAVQAGQAWWESPRSAGRLRAVVWRCRWLAYGALVFGIALFGMSGRRFVYFQF